MRRSQRPTASFHNRAIDCPSPRNGTSARPVAIVSLDCWAAEPPLATIRGRSRPLGEPVLQTSVRGKTRRRPDGCETRSRRPRLSGRPSENGVGQWAPHPLLSGRLRTWAVPNAPRNPCRDLDGPPRRQRCQFFFTSILIDNSEPTAHTRIGKPPLVTCARAYGRQVTMAGPADERTAADDQMAKASCR